MAEAPRMKIADLDEASLVRVRALEEELETLRAAEEELDLVPWPTTASEFSVGSTASAPLGLMVYSRRR